MQHILGISPSILQGIGQGSNRIATAVARSTGTHRREKARLQQWEWQESTVAFCRRGYTETPVLSEFHMNLLPVM